jgi:uncharacterized membrane protein
MADASTEYFTWASLGSLAGASAAVIVVTNAIQRARQRIYPMLPFVVSLLITFGTAWYAAQLVALPGWGLAFLNGCLLYCTATGANEVAVEVSRGQAPGATVHGRGPTGLISSWLR